MSAERDRGYESGERFRRPLSPHRAGQLPCNFVYVGKQLSRSHFSFVPFFFFFRFSFVRSRSLFDSISILLSPLIPSLSRYAPQQLQIICNFVCPRAFVLRLALKKKKLLLNQSARRRDVDTRGACRGLQEMIRVSILHLPWTDRFLTRRQSTKIK